MPVRLPLLFLTLTLLPLLAEDKPPDPACPICKGTGIVPLSPYKPYLRFDTQPPEAAPPPAWKSCPQCQKGKDAKTLSAEIKECQERARTKHAEIVQATGMKMELALTPFFAIHTNGPPANVKKLTDMLDKFIAQLQTDSRSMSLLPARPDVNDLYLFADKTAYYAYIDKTLTDTQTPEVVQMTKLSEGFSNKDMSIMYPGTFPFEKRAVYDAATQFIQSATDYKAKGTWLNEGFGTYWQYRMCGVILSPTGKPDTQINTATVWSAFMIKKVKAGNLKKWNDVFDFRSGESSNLDSMDCYSLVSYLYAIDASRFEKVVRLFKEGETSAAAIEKAYNRKLDDLEANWPKWIVTQK